MFWVKVYALATRARKRRQKVRRRDALLGSPKSEEQSGGNFGEEYTLEIKSRHLDALVYLMMNSQKSFHL